MRLEDLDARTFSPRVVLLQTESTKLWMFVQDKLRRYLSTRQESMVDIKKAPDLKSVRQVMTVSPPFSRGWLVQLEAVDRERQDLVNADLFKLIKDSASCLFFIRCEKYAVYKKIKDGLEGLDDVYDMYAPFLRRPDVLYLYDAFVPESKRLKGQLFDYVVQGYSADIDSLFDIFMNLASGVKYQTRADIVDRHGIGGLSVDSFLFSLCNPVGNGIKKVVSNRCRAVVELGGSIGFQTLYNYMCTSLKSIIELKVLLISGKVYKSVSNLPECYNESRLARYQRHIWRLNEIPLSEFLRIRQVLGDRPWGNGTDAMNFVYGYYNLKARY